MKKAFYKNNVPMVTCLFCVGWLVIVQRYITRAEPLIKPFVCDIFAAVVLWIMSMLLWSTKSHGVDISVFCSVLFVSIFAI